jgi:CBS-domain-containing membrane protein
MTLTTKPLAAFTAADLMSRDVITVPAKMTLPAAARLLSRAGISGAPVVDDAGRCVGVISASNFVQRVLDGSPATPVGPCVCADWQVIEPQSLPPNEVEAYMTPDPVTTPPSTSIVKLARMMLDAHIHRVIVVNAHGVPVGIVSTIDILAAVAHLDRGTEVSL